MATGIGSPERTIVVLVFLLAPFLASAQNFISTVAGNGIPDFSGDDGPATAASLYLPSDVAVDPDGNLYIADTANHRIRKVSPDGTITTVAGTGTPGGRFNPLEDGPATTALLNSPSGVAVDASGNLYIADSENYRIRQVTPEGIISTVAGNAIIGSTGDGGPADQASIGFVSGLAVDADGNLYIADQSHSQIRKVTPDGLITTAAGTGERGFSGDGGQATLAKLWLAGFTFNDGNREVTQGSGIAVDSSGNLYIADTFNNRIRMVALDGTITTVTGNGMVNNAGNGTLAILASVKAPVDVAVDGAGNLYISQHVSHIIRYVNPDGFIFTVAGIADDPGFSEDLGNPFTAKLNGPAGLVAEGEGAFLLADHRNHRIRFFQPKPQLSVLPASFDLEAIAGAVDPLLEMVTIANTVSGTASWTARATTPGGLGWLSIFPKTGLTPATVTVSVDASGLAVGDHRGTVFIAPVLDPADTALIPVRVAVAESAPVIGEGGIVNGASFSDEAAVSPGSIASLFGMNLAAGTETASGLPLPTMLAGTQVLVDDVPAPLFFVSPLQINFQVPFEATGSSVPMVVVSNGVRGPEVMVQVEPAAPGIFTAVPGGSGPGAILNEDFSPNSAENPAAAGSVVQIFATGLGATDPPLATGQTGASSPPLNVTVMVPVVMIGGAPAEVLFSGMAPGFVGLYQVNARVPAATPAGDEVPLEIEIGEGSSNTVTLAVR